MLIEPATFPIRRFAFQILHPFRLPVALKSCRLKPSFRFYYPNRTYISIKWCVALILNKEKTRSSSSLAPPCKYFDRTRLLFQALQ
jgi:hypothetical protein